MDRGPWVHLCVHFFLVVDTRMVDQRYPACMFFSLFLFVSLTAT